MASDLGQLVYTLTLNDEGFQSQLSGASAKVKESGGQMTGSMKETEEQSGKTGGAFSGMAGQFVAGAAIFTIAQKGLSLLKDTLKEGVKNFEEWQQNQAQIANSLKTTHDASGQTTKGLNEYAEALSGQTAISGNAINSAQLVMLNYKAIGKDIFPEATKQVANFATVLSHGAVPSQEEMQAAAKKLGTALEDPAKGMARLKIAGIVLSEDQKTQIKNLQESGKLQQAQKLLLSDVADVIGGKATTASHTLAGEQARLKEVIEDVQIKIGQKLTQALKAVEPYLAKFADWLLKHKPILEAIAVTIGILAAVVAGAMVAAIFSAVVGFLALSASMLPFIAIAIAVGVVAVVIMNYWKDLKQWFHDFVNDTKKIFDDVTRAINKGWQDTWKDIKQIVMDVIHAIGAVLTPFYDVFKFIFETEYAIAMWVWHGIYNDAVKPIIEAIKVAIHIMGDIISAIWHFIRDTAINDWHLIWGVVKPIVDAISSVMTGAWHIISGVWNAAYGFFANLFGGITKAGSNAASSVSGFFSGIWGGIKSGAKAGVNEVISILDNMIKAYNSSVGKIPGAPHIGSIPKFASGVQNFGGGLALLGEQGPELAYLPGGSNVYSNSQTQKMMGNTYHIGQVVLSTAQAVDEFFNIGNRNTQLELAGGSPLAGTTGV